MRFPAVVVATLSLLSVGLSAPVINCKNLTRPIEIESREQLLGKWMVVAGSANIPGIKVNISKVMGNSWVKITAANEDDGLQSAQYQKVMDICYFVRINMTLANNTLSSELFLRAKNTMMHTSCEDCLVVYAEYPTPSNVLTGLQLLSKRRTVTDAEMEEFKEQVQCLGLPAPAVADTESALCPEHSESQDTQTKDMTDTLRAMGDRFRHMMDELLKGLTGAQDLSGPDQ